MGDRDSYRVVMERPLIDRLSAVSSTSIADAGPSLVVLPTSLRPVVPGRKFAGRAVTVRAERDLMGAIAGLAAAEPGDVLVIDAGGDDRAVAGELFSTEAQRRGLAAFVVFGRCRDSAILATLDLPIYCTGFAPNAYAAQAVPQIAVPLDLAGARVEPGDLLMGDDDGIVCGSAGVMAAAIEKAGEMQSREEGLQRDIDGGQSMAAVHLPVGPRDLCVQVAFGDGRAYDGAAELTVYVY